MGEDVKIGTVLNVRQDWRGFAFWVVANTGWVVIDYRAGLYAQALMFFVYLVLALWGIFDWRRKKEATSDARHV